MTTSLEELFDFCNRNDISVANIPEDVMCASTDAALKGEDTFDVPDNIFAMIDGSHQKEVERQKQYNAISEYRLAGMKAESDGNIDDAINQYAEAIEMGEASEFDLLHAYRHAYERIIILLSRTRAYTREALYIKRLMKYNLQEKDHKMLTEKLKIAKSKILSVCSILVCTLSLFCACSNVKDKPYIEQYVDRLVEMYPNYESNDIAKSSLLDSITNRTKAVSDLQNVKFTFIRFIENKTKTNGNKSALFTSSKCIISPNPNRTPKNITTFIRINVLGSVDAQTAALLDRNVEYEIDGILHAWDEEDLFLLSSTYDDIYLGTYILDNMKVTQSVEK